MHISLPYPVVIGTVMLVFDGSHAESTQHLWKLATIIKLDKPASPPEIMTFTVDEARVAQAYVSAQVAWQDGSVSSGHFVSHMRYPDSAATPYVHL